MKYAIFLMFTLASQLSLAESQEGASEIENKSGLPCSVEFKKNFRATDISDKKFAVGLSDCRAGDLLFFQLHSASFIIPALRVCEYETIQYVSAFAGSCKYTGQLLDLRTDKGIF